MNYSCVVLEHQCGCRTLRNKTEDCMEWGPTSSSEAQAQSRHFFPPPRPGCGRRKCSRWCVGLRLPPLLLSLPSSRALSLIHYQPLSPSLYHKQPSTLLHVTNRDTDGNKIPDLRRNAHPESTVPATPPLHYTTKYRSRLQQNAVCDLEYMASSAIHIQQLSPILLL